MAEKVLTISVAAYNVENYIEQALDSCLIPSKDLLDVIVVDDGGTDSTASIVEKYVERFPSIFRLVRKENGGYGSTVNTSLKLARGTYFKLLDGDDWFDKDALEFFVNVLRSNGDFDLLITSFARRYEDKTVIVDQVCDTESGTYHFDDIQVPQRITVQGICYRTDLLRESGLQLPEHCFYTDIEYITQPLSLVEKVHISHVPLLQYRLGHSGQSVSNESLVKNRENAKLVLSRVIKIYSALPSKNTMAAEITRAWINYESVQILHRICQVKTSKDTWHEIDDFRRVVFQNPDIAKAVISHSEWALIFSKTTQRTYPFVARASRLYKKVR